MTIAEKVLSSIVKIIDRNSEEPITYNELKVIKSTNKFSSDKNPIWRLVLDGKELTKNTKFVIQYKCLLCDKLCKVGTTQFFRKINSNRINGCFSCHNLCDMKRTKQSMTLHNTLTMGDNIIKPIKSKNQTFEEKLRNSLSLFSKLTEQKKQAYYEKHLTTQEFKEIIKPNLISFRNGGIKGDYLDRLEYIPIFQCQNQMKFTSIFYDSVDDTLLKADQPILKCQVCDIHFRSKSLENHKGSLKIMCKSCKLCNKSFKKHKIKNMIGHDIIYQSKQELDFIHWCNHHNIIVENGPLIEYRFHNGKHIYHVDFVLPDKNIIIEIKDNHIWHKKQIESGKWKAKISAMKEHLKCNGGKYEAYYMIFPRNKQYILKKLLNYFT